MKYQIILADPPWRFGSRGPRSGRFGDLDYGTMSVEEICSLQVEDIADTTAALFLWFPGSFVEAAPLVARSWGFAPVRIDKVWRKVHPSGKPKAAAGPWGMSDAEFLLLATRGQMCSLQVRPRNQYVIESASPSALHSEKPELFHHLIERRFIPGLKRIELFARSRRPGWDACGDEVQSDIELGMGAPAAEEVVMSDEEIEVIRGLLDFEDLEAEASPSGISGGLLDSEELQMML
jgi:site-specific DNA-methyltransferase (adenine-specific)